MYMVSATFFLKVDFADAFFKNKKTRTKFNLLKTSVENPFSQNKSEDQ